MLKKVPLQELVDPSYPQRDGSIMPDDPKLSRMANLVRYMRRMPIYMPPNPWPEAMLLYGVNDRGCLNCAFIMPLTQFEAIPKAELFGLYNKEAVRLFFCPVPKMPESDLAAKHFIDAWLAKTTPDDLKLITLYLDVNRWVWHSQTPRSRMLCLPVLGFWRRRKPYYKRVRAGGGLQGSPARAGIDRTLVK